MMWNNGLCEGREMLLFILDTWFGLLGVLAVLYALVFIYGEMECVRDLARKNKAPVPGTWHQRYNDAIVALAIAAICGLYLLARAG